MKVIICMDDTNGIMFNHRRQSQDKLIRAKIFSILNGYRLFVSHYTAKQFTTEECRKLSVVDEPLAEAGPDDFCFAEDYEVDVSNPAIKSIIVFRWNRVYPSDRFFDAAPLKEWNLSLSEDFVGNSHEKITMEVYER